MGIARGYDLLVRVLSLRQQPSTFLATEYHASLFVFRYALSSTDLCIHFSCLRPMLFIRSGFYDGRKPVVEPLSNPVFMPRDHTNTRLVEVVRGISSLRP